jgi:predicted RNA-binding protein with PUA-like domain
MRYWLVKTDPEAYSWEQFLKDKTTVWDGVRNYQARNNLKEMKTGDRVLFYNSGEDREVKGIVVVTKEFFPDPTTDDERWVAIGLKVEKKFKKYVTLDIIKNDKSLADIALIRQSRLSVMPLTEPEFQRITELSK